ncbi:MAG: nuclear transport factor 2 family protein [Alphaproteobacteria bacterium]|nr:nuclear transport factor 2 family protein [Alphaproteobacteria bacterium]
MAEYEATLPKLKAAYQAWHDSRGKSIDTWIDLFDDTVDLRSLAGGHHGIPWSKSRVSRDGVRAYLNELTDHMTMAYCRVDRFVCQDDCIVVIGSTCWHHNQTGKPAESAKVDVWQFRNGKAIAFHEYYDTARVMGAAVP